jgi:methylmalonyl-CoA/ethylmalonyl-CoA epimerase
MMIKRLHHVAIAVNNLEEGVSLYERLLGVKPASIEGIPGQGVRVAVFKVGGEAEIELLQPIGPDSPVAKFLASRGQGIHHICFEVDDIDRELEAMAARGFELIDKVGREGLEGRVGFLHPRAAGGVLIELVQCPG